MQAPLQIGAAARLFQHRLKPDLNIQVPIAAHLPVYPVGRNLRFKGG